MDVIEPMIPWYPGETTAMVIPSCWTWQETDPLAVTVRFGNEEHGVTWVFGRDLIACALTHGKAGIGDVKLTVKQGTIAMELTSPFGEIKLRTDANFLAEFLKKTFAEVSAGTELDCLPLTDQHLQDVIAQWECM